MAECGASCTRSCTSIGIRRRHAVLRSPLATPAALWSSCPVPTPPSIEQLHAALIEIMKAGKTAPFRQRYDEIAPVIGRAFDLEAIVRQVIGPRWTTLPPEQQAALTDAFRRYTIASYVANFNSY